MLHAEIKQRLDSAIKHDIQKVNGLEYEFWKLLTETHLKPTSEAFSLLGQLKGKLVHKTRIKSIFSWLYSTKYLIIQSVTDVHQLFIVFIMYVKEIDTGNL